MTAPLEHAGRQRQVRAVKATSHGRTALQRGWEVERDYAYNRALFMRVAQGWYQFNPKLSVRRRRGDKELWVPIYAALNLPLVSEFAWDDGWDSVVDRIAEYLNLAELPERPIPIAAERAVARQKALAREEEARANEERAALERWRKEQAEIRERQQAEKPKWGTPEAKRQEIERIRREIEERKKR
jgi:hypothetical protein